MSCSLEAQISMQGMYQGRLAKVFQVLGQRNTYVNTTAFHDAAAHLTTGLTIDELTGTETFEIVSDSASDTAAGVGTRTVTICHINLSYKLVSETFTLNGLTPVSLGAFRSLCILWMEAETGGSNPTTVGNVDLRYSGAGAIQARIIAGGNKSLNGIFMVPDGYEALVPSWDTHSIRQAHDCRLRATVRTVDRTLGTRYIFQDNAFMGADQQGEHSLPYLKYPARSKIKISIMPFSLAGTPRLDCSFSVIILEGN